MCGAAGARDSTESALRAYSEPCTEGTDVGGESTLRATHTPRAPQPCHTPRAPHSRATPREQHSRAAPSNLRSLFSPPLARRSTVDGLDAAAVHSILLTSPETVRAGAWRVCTHTQVSSLRQAKMEQERSASAAASAAAAALEEAQSHSARLERDSATLRENLRLERRSYETLARVLTICQVCGLAADCARALGPVRPRCVCVA